MVEAADVKLKDHLWYLSERLVPLALFSARVSHRDKKRWQLLSLNKRTKSFLIANKCLKQKILGQSFLNISLDRTHGPFLNCPIERNRHSKQREFWVVN